MFLQKLAGPGGNVNCMMKVSKGDDDNDAVIVRIQCRNSLIREDPSTLAIVMRVAEAGGVGAPVLASFNNGLVYGYAVGEIINPDVIPHTDHILR